MLQVSKGELDALIAKGAKGAKVQASAKAAPARELLGQLMSASSARVIRPGLRHKYHAVRTERDGFPFPSKMEACYYDRLKMEKAAGLVVQFLMQVPFHIPASPQPIIYRLDFLVFMATGDVRLVEVKGQQTEGFKLKRRLVEHHYAPLKLELWCLKGKNWEDIS